MTEFTFRIDAELPSIPLNFEDRDGDTQDFSTGWTATVDITTAAAPTTSILTKTSGIALAATSPNYVVSFSSADLSTISTALGTIPNTGTECLAHCRVRRDSDSADLFFRNDRPPVKLLFLPAVS